MFLQAALGEHAQAVDPAPCGLHVEQHGVQQGLNAGLQQHLVEHQLQDLGRVLHPVHAVPGGHGEHLVRRRHCTMQPATPPPQTTTSARSGAGFMRVANFNCQP
jgi:hypothetical protein